MVITDNLLRVNIAGIEMKSPIMTASGTFGFGLEYADFLDLNQVGAVVVKGTTLEPKAGNKGKRIAETPMGMLNSIGLENPGVEEFLTKILPEISHYDVPVIVNISGNTVDEYKKLAEILNKSTVTALEVNISCPNVKQGGIAFGVCPEDAQEVVRGVKENTDKPVIVKLSPNVTDITMMAKAVEEAKADAISLINTLIGMAIDIKTKKPVLGNIIGGLSGPAIKPIALRMVWQVANSVNIPVIGMGGISKAEDAIEFFLAGANAIAIGTHNFVNPAAVEEITAGIRSYLIENNHKNINDLVGKLIIE